MAYAYILMDSKFDPEEGGLISERGMEVYSSEKKILARMEYIKTANNGTIIPNKAGIKRYNILLTTEEGKIHHYWIIRTTINPYEF